ncbi:hypothetical protein ACEN2T_17605 [Pseudomonas sp. W22_MBD1_FP4]|uniref:hypothetical protein n=1 Tax=Pseudomonas sp. W22_MBD1_FP4 TaxID=3240272 RepID=UPI003F9766EB
MSKDDSLLQVEQSTNTAVADSDVETPLNYTAFEDVLDAQRPTIALPDENAALIKLDDPALDSLGIEELLNRAFTSIRMEEGLSADRAEDDLHFDELDDPSIGALIEEHASDPELGTPLTKRPPIPEISAVSDSAADEPEAGARVDASPEKPVELAGEAPLNPIPTDPLGTDMDFDEEFRPASEVLGATMEQLQPTPSATNEDESPPDTDSRSHLHDQKLKGAFSMAREMNGAELMDGIANVQSSGPNANYPESQIRVGLIQGLSMLGGAGLAGLAKMVQSGGSTINNRLRQRQYGKLSGEIDQITHNMDSLMVKMNANGLSAGLEGLEGAKRTEFMNEFLELPANKGMFNELITSLGSLATKSTEAAVVGAAAGLSPDQLDSEITRRISDVQQKHKSLLESMSDHNGVSLSDRLSNIAAQLASAIDKLFQRASQALGFGPRPGM